MALFAKAAVNMDGSDDPGYRYTMPKLEIKVEGSSSKMRKTVLVNLGDVSRSIGRPAEYLLTYLGHRLSAATKMEKETGKAYVTGAYAAADLQGHVLKFVREAVLCHHCRNPETTCHLEGRKKRQMVFLKCKACPNRSDLDPSDRFVKFMMAHMPQELGRGDAGGGEVRGPAQDLASQSSEKLKRTCPSCGHRTTKTSCSKCGASTIAAPAGRASGEASKAIAPGFIAESKPERPKRTCSCGHKTTKPTCSKCGTSLLAMAGVAEADGDSSDEQARDDVQEESVGSMQGTVARWMMEHGSADEHDATGLVEKFNGWLQSRGYDQSDPSDRFRAVVSAAAVSACATLDLSALPSQPMAVAEHAKPILGKWQPLLHQLFADMGDASEATASAVAAVQEAIATTSGTVAGADIAMLGIVMSLGDLIEGIGDEELILGCERLPSRSRAVEKFIEFLRDADSDEDSDED